MIDMDSDRLSLIVMYVFQFMFLVCFLSSLLYCRLRGSIGWLLFAKNCMSERCKDEMGLNKDELMPAFKTFAAFRIFVLFVALIFSVSIHKCQYVAGFIIVMGFYYVVFDVHMKSYYGKVKDKYNKVSDLILDDFTAFYCVDCYRYVLISNLMYAVVFFWWFCALLR